MLGTKAFIWANTTSSVRLLSRSSSFSPMHGITYKQNQQKINDPLVTWYLIVLYNNSLKFSCNWWFSCDPYLMNFLLKNFKAYHHITCLPHHLFLFSCLMNQVILIIFICHIPHLRTKLVALLRTFPLTSVSLFMHLIGWYSSCWHA